MKPLLFLILADWLIKNKKCEEGFRSCVSRAYYSAFHTALDFLAEMGVHIPSGDNKHNRVPDLLESTDDADIKEAAAKLKDLREHRNTADYLLRNKDAASESFALLRYGEASRIIGAIGTCLATKGVTGGRFEKATQGAQKRAQLLFLGNK